MSLHNAKYKRLIRCIKLPWQENTESGVHRRRVGRIALLRFGNNGVT